ncbi:glyoxalase [Streptomyces finlayi]|uniref:Glyoxalase n=1 Tax=Streptomyces finlayi TaxID=67296 RepID=A0A918WVJ9_9ACTN|nr:VOC family protein [Streptomyces finlayi]GHC87525.1 glyoxalase [Streptomyces finlayi]
MEWTLEVVMVPVSDIDRAKDFYAQKCGFKVDIDMQISETTRVVQLTPTGSRCSIVLTEGMAPPAEWASVAAPGSLQGMQVCVVDVVAGREELAGRGVDISPVMHLGEKGWEEGKGDTWNSWAYFRDPDGNGWVLQEAPAPLSER